MEFLKQQTRKAFLLIAGALAGASILIYILTVGYKSHEVTKAQLAWDKAHYTGWRLSQPVVQDERHGMQVDNIEKTVCSTKGFPGYPFCPNQAYYEDGKATSSTPTEWDKDGNPMPPNPLKVGSVVVVYNDDGSQYGKPWEIDWGTYTPLRKGAVGACPGVDFVNGKLVKTDKCQTVPKEATGTAKSRLTGEQFYVKMTSATKFDPNAPYQSAPQ